MQLERSHNVDDTSWSPIVTDDHDVLKHQWLLGVWYDQSSERITRMANHEVQAFRALAVKSGAATFVVAQIETFASHIGDTRCWHLQQLVCHKNCHFCVSSKCLWVDLQVCLKQKKLTGCHSRFFGQKNLIKTKHCRAVCDFLFAWKKDHFLQQKLTAFFRSENFINRLGIKPFLEVWAVA